MLVAAFLSQQVLLVLPVRRARKAMLSCLFLTCFMLINEVIDGVTHQLRIFYLEAIFSFFNCIVSSAGR